MRGEYMSSIKSCDLRTYSLGSSSHNSLSSAPKHTSGNMTRIAMSSKCGCNTLYVNVTLSALERCVTAKFTTRFGIAIPVVKELNSST